MRNCIQAILLDFDYTLADSSMGVVECIEFAMKRLGLPSVPAERACRTIGLSLRDTFLHLAGAGVMAQADEFARLFIQRADEVMVDLTVLFDSVPRTVEALKTRKVALGIVSTKFRSRIEQILRRQDLLDSFDIIVGGEDVSDHKPSPEGLLMAIAGLGCSSSNCFYAGDSVADAETAKRAGIPFVAVLSGITSREDFFNYDVYGTVETVSDLPGLI